MLGLMTLSWAWAETSLAMTIGLIQEYSGPIAGHSESPVSLQKKIKCLKIALRDTASLHPFKQEASVLIKGFVELSVRRNSFVHGAALEMKEGIFQSATLKVISGKYSGEYHHFDIGDLHALNTETAKLCDDMTAFMLKVAETLSRVAAA
jgi:hypothetical protein